MPDLYDSTDESEAENASNSDLEDDEELIWEEEDLSRPHDGKFRPERPAFPKFRSIHPPGPINIPPGTTSPVDYLNLYLDPDIMDVFVENTNLFGAKFFSSKGKSSNSPHQGRWKPTTRSEIYRFFGVLLHMGMKRQPSMRSYWSNDPRFSDAFVKKCFTRDRFEMIKTSLHVVNPNEFSPAQLKKMQKDDSFWRVSPFLEHLSDAYQRYYVCDQDFDIDEMCIGFKGRHVARCYNPNKPDKWHLKAFCLNDSSSGYLHRFYMYQGFIFSLFFNSPN